MNTPSPYTFVLFGATGDLSLRKVLPALFRAFCTGQLEAEGDADPAGRILAVARTSMDAAGYHAWCEAHVRAHIKPDVWDEPTWKRFLATIDYMPLDLGRQDEFRVLAERLARRKGVRIFYLATGPSLFIPICEGLRSAKLNENSRIVLEKPLGHDLASSEGINDAVGTIFREDQIYRIDHYLGKEAVQNLLALRFGNAIFEPLWRRELIDSIQITIAEAIGVEGRGEFYEQTGALRDMVQNHLLQLLAIVAMEPPLSMSADAVRDEKLRVLRSLRQMDDESVAHNVVRGQYGGGAIDKSAVPAYVDEPGVPADSQTETFVALKAEIDNWRWAGVPFFLRTGKRLGERVAEIVVNYRATPYPLLGAATAQPGANRLVIRLQPNESIRLYCLAKQPGEGMNLQTVHLDLAFDQFFKGHRMDAYERLLLDVINGRLALFVRRDEQEQAWRWVAPIQTYWARQTKGPKRYAAGTWGPPAASALLAQSGRSWVEEEN
ncbi:glucose-6-phosphate dehydrogenase [Pandoraea pulmonicola]|uniref:Glucose-6-phosphate 1-dehydrogenase n=1 Tax=Pandoraea pulmonicola TaxID=93221 RepID=A0AAJ4ZAM9_PANPU|nr:glucose-6-phosphate dehydrogenase [Pandoraea pulmonicola]AJC21427.1 glucose-6-phosphate dehydrogenase [Pandoraea pulmonicola]SUA89817.1 Glucose-6-phosphate 1-dehydrogenase [Pandoraea pulmonicola]